jgi:hypothetical protein
MDKLRKATLIAMGGQLAAHRWSEDEIDELVAPRMGVITGFQELLDQIERLRAVDLGSTPPATASIGAKAHD